MPEHEHEFSSQDKGDTFKIEEETPRTPAVPGSRIESRVKAHALLMTRSVIEGIADRLRLAESQLDELWNRFLSSHQEQLNTLFTSSFSPSTNRRDFQLLLIHFFSEVLGDEQSISPELRARIELLTKLREAMQLTSEELGEEGQYETATEKLINHAVRLELDQLFLGQ